MPVHYLLGLSLLAVALCATACAAQTDLHLVREGKATSVIVVSENASSVTNDAARVLQAYLHKISGAKVPLCIEESLSLPDVDWLGDGTLALVSIGETKLAQEAGLSVAGLEPEGFLIETRDNTLFILGREDRLDTTQLRPTGWLGLVWPIPRQGTLFGVCTFLEDYLGVRWLWPGELGEVVPPAPSIAIPAIQRVEAPALPVRKIRPALTSSANKGGSLALGESYGSMLGRIARTQNWIERMGMGESLVISQSHAYGDAFWEKYREEHPEWFALFPGIGRAVRPVIYSETPGLDRVQLCHSNEELQAEVARIVIEKWKDNPAVFSIEIGEDDVSLGEVYCACDECAAFGPTLSDRIFRFSSAVAELVAQQYPELHVTQFAYGYYNEAPVEVKVHENVVVSYVGTFTSGYLHDPHRAENWEIWDGWAEAVEGKLLWRPNLPPTLGVPALFIGKLAEDLRRFQPKLWGADIDCMDHSWAAGGLHNYVMAKLLWNPEADVEQIILDYCQAGFGPASEPVREYFRVLERNTSELATLTPDAGYHIFVPFTHTYYNEQRVGELRDLLAEAHQLAGEGTVYRQRVEFLQTALDWLELSLPAWALYSLGDEADEPQKDQAEALVREMYAFLREHRESYALHTAYIESKIGWMWRNFFGDGEERDWSQAQ